VDLEHALLHPGDVVVDPALPAVLKRPNLGLVASDHFIVAIGEEGRIEIDEVDAVGRELRQPPEVVIPIENARLQEADWLHGGDFCHDLSSSCNLRFLNELLRYR